jgi:ketosteroid isomerase-like protein
MTIAPRESEIARCIEEYGSAYVARDLDRIMDLFADDAEYTLAPGTFRGKDEIRKLLEWDARLSPKASVRDAGIGLLVSGKTAVWERVISLTADGVPYEEETATIFELDDEGKIRRVRSYYDKLAMLDDIASAYPGLKGWILRRMTRVLVAQGSKGLEARPA